MTPPVRILVVTADDFALTEQVSAAIVSAHHAGIVTSTSVLAVAPAFDHAIRILDDAPELGIGVHLAAVGEDPPLLSAREIPTLVSRKGQFAETWRTFLPRVMLGRVDPADLRREFTAQVERVRDAGLTITHIDSHQHVHLWPTVAEAALDVAASSGLSGVRITRSERTSPVGITVRRLAARLEAGAAQRGLASTDASAGLDETGRMSLDRLLDTVTGLAARTVASAELSTHPRPLPGDDPALARYASTWVHADERAALVHPSAREAVERAGFTLGTYADLRGC